MSVRCLMDEQAARLAWQAGLIACLGSGLIEFGGAFVAEKIRKITPRAALLSTLAGIAMTFIAMPFVFKMFENPIMGLSTFAVVLAAYFGGMKFKAHILAGFFAVLLDTGLAYITGMMDGNQANYEVGFHVPVPVIGDLIAGTGT